jgi:hypothetical protein
VSAVKLVTKLLASELLTTVLSAAWAAIATVRLVHGEWEPGFEAGFIAFLLMFPGRSPFRDDPPGGAQ